MRTPHSLAVAGACAALVTGAALAQVSAGKSADLPVKPVRMIIPYPPGGTSDILARLIGTKLSQMWGHQFLVDNRSGAAGIIGVDLTAKAAPDGYTYVLTDLGNLAIFPSVYKVPFDLARDFAAVTVVSYSPHLLTTHPSLPVKTVRDLVNLAKANPDRLNVSTGLGSASHLAGLAIEQRTGAKFRFIGTRGGTDSSRMVMQGDAEVLIQGMLQTIPHVKNGRLKLLAVSSDKHVATLPDTPTIAESLGFAGFVSGSWQGILTQAKVAPDIVARMNADVVKVLHLPDVKEKLNAQGTEPIANSPEQAWKWFMNEHDRVAKLIRDTGFELE